MSWLCAEDVPVFLALLDDVFPSMPTDAVFKASMEQMESNITREIKQSGLQQHKPWIKKILQLHEATKLSHGVIVVGPAGSGKSTAISLLSKVLSRSSLPLKVCFVQPYLVSNGVSC